MTVKISAVMPVYNMAKYLREAIESVLNQTLKEIELICVDDGSTDGSAKIIADFAKKDDQVRLIRQSNQGAGVARNTGIKAAKGEYIAFLDADDYYPGEDTLARIYAVAKANNADICGGSFCEVDGDRKITQFDGLRTGNAFVGEGWVNFTDYQFDYGFYRFIYRREFLIKNNTFFPTYRRYQDPPFMLRAFAAAGMFYAVPDVTYCYRVGATVVNWDEQKVFDLLCGIEDELKFSVERGYEKVHALNYHRLCNDFCGVIVSTALRSDGSKIIKKLIKLQSFVNVDVLERSGLFDAEELEFSRPLAQLISKFGEQSKQITTEGWFINNKLFRLCTSPVRAIGKYLRKKRGKK